MKGVFPPHLSIFLNTLFSHCPNIPEFVSSSFHGRVFLPHFLAVELISKDIYYLHNLRQQISWDVSPQPFEKLLIQLQTAESLFQCVPHDLYSHPPHSSAGLSAMLRNTASPSQIFQLSCEGCRTPRSLPLRGGCLLCREQIFQSRNSVTQLWLKNVSERSRVTSIGYVIRSSSDLLREEPTFHVKGRENYLYLCVIKSHSSLSRRQVHWLHGGSHSAFPNLCRSSASEPRAGLWEKERRRGGNVVLSCNCHLQLGHFALILGVIPQSIAGLLFFVCLFSFSPFF